jgi:adenylylsulfate kinase
MTAPRDQLHIRRHDALLSRDERTRLLGSRGSTLWFTGLSASGKSTIAAALELELARRAVFAYRLDGDNLRLGLNTDLGFSAEDRDENIRRVGEVARLFADAGVIAITSFISPYRAARDRARRQHETDPLGPVPFLEIFVDTPIQVCEQRDPKGLYKKARAGQLTGFTGIDDPYEPPLNPELVLKAGEWSVDRCVAACVEMLEHRGIVGARR